MKHTNPVFLFVAMVITGIVACSKEAADRSGAVQNTTANSNKAQAAGAITSVCDLIVYPDSVFYLSQSSVDYIVKPLHPLTGTYSAFPAGLAINPVNGNINVTRSETGLRYKVWFVAQGTTDTCIKYITVSGVNYNDSIYVLSNNPDTAAPIYNANTLKPVNCNDCEFDDGPDDDNGNGIADEPPASQQLIPQGIAINKKTGVINVKKSIQNGALGKNPAPGTYKDFVLNYRLGDKSGKALNKITFRLYYYATQAQIPANLKADLATKESQVLLENEDENDNSHGGGDSGGGSGGSGKGHNRVALSASASQKTTSKKGAGEVKCRPPYIIVTQQ